MDNIVPGGPAVVGGPVANGFPRRPASVAGGRYSSQPQLCSSTEQLDMFPDTGNMLFNLFPHSSLGTHFLPLFMIDLLSFRRAPLC